MVSEFGKGVERRVRERRGEGSGEKSEERKWRRRLEKNSWKRVVWDSVRDMGKETCDKK